MPRIVHFDITADEPERAAGFYGEVFGWKFDKWEGPFDYWMVKTGPDEEPGIDGGMSLKEQGAPAGFVNTIDVPDVDAYAAKIEENGGKVVSPKMAIEGVGYLAMCQDTEGNVFNIMTSDESARM